MDHHQMLCDGAKIFSPVITGSGSGWAPRGASTPWTGVPWGGGWRRGAYVQYRDECGSEKRPITSKRPFLRNITAGDFLSVRSRLSDPIVHFNLQKIKVKINYFLFVVFEVINCIFSFNKRKRFVYVCYTKLCKTAMDHLKKVYSFGNEFFFKCWACSY